MTTINKHQINFRNKITWHRCNGFFLILGLWGSLLQTAVAGVRPLNLVEKGVPITNGHSYNIWAPEPKGKIWFMATTPGTSNITMKVQLCRGCPLSPLVNIDGGTTFHEIKNPNKWNKVQLSPTVKYGQSTVNIEGEHFYPKGQNKHQSPQVIHFNGTSDLYWAKLDPNEEPFLKLSSATCSSLDTETRTWFSSNTSDDGHGFKLDIVTMVSLGVNAVLVLLLIIIVCYYKQKIRAEITLRKSREHQKVSYRQSLDPSACIVQPSYPQALDPAAYISSEDQTHEDKYETYNG